MDITPITDTFKRGRGSDEESESSSFGRYSQMKRKKLANQNENTTKQTTKEKLPQPEPPLDEATIREIIAANEHYRAQIAELQRGDETKQKLLRDRNALTQNLQLFTKEFVSLNKQIQTTTALSNKCSTEIDTWRFIFGGWFKVLTAEGGEHLILAENPQTAATISFSLQPQGESILYTPDQCNIDHEILSSACYITKDELPILMEKIISAIGTMQPEAASGTP
uniref:Uncharacterized protein n=1 Tax=Arcella intermedia TaxID=1963864 RepID=A0A6B2LDX6_9EUKA